MGTAAEANDFCLFVPSRSALGTVKSVTTQGLFGLYGGKIAKISNNKTCL